MKRILSAVLAFVMLLSMLPVQALATDTRSLEAQIMAQVNEMEIEETTVPEETVPETTVPETTIPETTVPETTVPETEPVVPETTEPVPAEPVVPETTAPAPVETEPTVPQMPQSQEVTSGTCGESVTWEMTEGGTLYLRGTGPIEDYSSASAVPWSAHRANILSIVVEEGVTSLCDYAFSSCSALTQVSLPETLELIGHHAFERCTSLTEVTLPDAVTAIGRNAFYYCSVLEKVTLPLSWETCLSTSETATGYNYQGAIFQNCKALKEITVPEGMLILPAYAFSNTDYVETIHLPETLEAVSAGAFYNCGKLKNLEVPEKVSTIGTGAFQRCDALTSMAIPSGVTILEDSVFQGCSALKTVSLPSGLTSIGDEAFSGCSNLESLVIPDGVQSLGYKAFNNCYKLSSITLPAAWNACPSYQEGNSGSSYQGNLFGGCKALAEIKVPDGLTKIPDYAFYGADYVQSILLPASLTTLAASEFYNCKALQSIALPAGIPELPAKVFYGCKALTQAELPAGLTSIGQEAFSGCSSLESLVIPDSVQSLGHRAFYNCSKLSSITLPASWNACPSYREGSSGNSYQGNLFVGCKALAQIKVPDGLTKIPDYAFYGADYVQTILLPDSLTTLAASEFYNCKALQSIAIPAGIPELPEKVFYGCKALKQVELPAGLTTIGREAFSGCSALESLVIPDSVQSLGYHAFSDCASLVSITLPASWVSCPSYREGSSGSNYQGNLFYGCKALTEIKVPDGLTKIPDYAFCNASYIQKIQLPASLTTLTGETFNGCSALQSIAIPAGITELPERAFYGCKALKQVELPAGMTAIGREAFTGCSVLESLVIPDSVQSLGYHAFSDCVSLISITLPASWNACPSYREGSSGSSYQGGLFVNCQQLTTITLPEGMQSLPDYAFYRCNYLQTVQLPASLKNLGAYSLQGCSALQSIQVPEGVTDLAAFAFADCTALAQVQLPASLISIGREAFSGCSSLESLVIPDSVQSLGYRAFANCKALTSITLPASWNACPSYREGSSGSNYQGNLFVGCTALTEVTVPEGLTVLPAYAFYNCDGLQTVYLPAGLTNLGSYAFYDCDGLLSMTLPEGITTVDNKAFSNCNNLQQIQLPSTLQTIAEYAFEYCESLTEVPFPEGLTTIDKYGFSNCKSLKSLILPDSVQKIGAYAFSGCTALEEIFLPPDVEIGNGAFNTITTSGTINNISWDFNLETYTLKIRGSGDIVFERDEENKVKVPWKHLRGMTKTLILDNGIMSIDDEAFRGFIYITALDTGNTVRRLGAYSFADCTSLKRVVLGEGMKLVETGAFSGCSALTQLVIISADGDLQIAPDAIPNTAQLTITYPETEPEYEDLFSGKYPNVGLETWDNTLPSRDVVLVLDTSGSMDGDRIENLKEAVNVFLDRVGGTATNSRVAIVEYNSEAVVLSGFSWSMDQQKSIVSTLNANGGTEYLTALNKAETVLQESKEDVRAMIFFTDGEPNDSEDPILEKCKELRKEYRIYTVGFMPTDRGHQLLQKMAGGGKNYYHANDVEALAEAFKALSGGVGSEVEDEEYYSLTVQRHFTIKSSKGGFPADIGFQIKVDDRTYKSTLAEDALVSEDTVIADIPQDFTGSVSLFREGYVTYNMPAALIGNHNVVVMHPDTEKDPFPQQLLYQAARDRQSYRNCFERVSIAEAALMDDNSVTQRFYVDIQWQGHTPGRVWLSQGTQTLDLQDKQFCDIPLSKTFRSGAGSVYLNFQSADGYTGSIKTDIYISPADNRIPLELGDGMSIPEEDMKDVKILGERKFSVDFSEWTEVPIAFEVSSDGTISGTIGLRKNGKDLGASVKGDGETLREAFNKLEREQGMSEDKMNDMLDELTQMGEAKPGKFGLEGKVWLMGYFSGKLDDNGQLEFKEIKVYMIAEGSVSYTLPFTVMGIPLYFKTQLAAAIEAAVFLKQQEKSLIPTAGAVVDCSMTISVGGGIGAEGVLSGGVQGDGKAGMEVPLLEPADMRAYVDASFSLVGTLLGLNGKWELWNMGKTYFYKDGEFTWTKEMSDALNENNFTLIPEPFHRSQFYQTGLAQKTNTMPYQVLKTDTTQFSDPKLITYDNGTKLAVWVDAVPGRVGADVHGIYYSYFGGSSWSTPRLVDDDGTNDYGLSLAEADGKVYVLWHDYDVVFGRDLTEVQQAAEHIDISVARFDPASGTMSAAKTFSAGGYDHQPQLRKHNGQVQLAWKCGVEEPEPMYLAVSQDGTSWNAPSQQSVSWYTEREESVPSDYQGEPLGNLGEVDNVEEDGLRAIVFRRNDNSGNQNIFAVYNAGSGWGKPIQLTYFKDGTYVDTFSAQMYNEQLEIIMNVTGSSGKSDLAYMQVNLGTDLAMVRADYDHFTLVPGKSAVFFARVTNRGAKKEDMLKLRLVDAQGNVLKTQLSEAVIESGDTVRLEMNYDVPADNSLQDLTLVVLPVHGTDINEANNSKSFRIDYEDISVEEIRAFSSEDKTMLTARVVNRGNVALSQVKYTLHNDSPDGQQVYAGTIQQLDAGQVETLNLEIDHLEVGKMLYLLVEELENENLSSNNMGMATIQSVYGDAVQVTSVTIDREYVALEAGQTVQLNATSVPSDGQSKIQWRVEDTESADVITVSETGLVTAHSQGTAYAVAYVQNGDNEVAARCRVDVTAVPVAAELSGVQLGSSGVTTELYSRKYASFEVLLLLDQNKTASVEDKPAALGVAVTAARFENATMAQYFDLVPADDRTLLIVPKDAAIEKANTLKSSYTGKVIVTVDGEEFTTPTTLKLTVKKTLPKPKASSLKFNSFYPDRTEPIKITGATVTQIRKDPAKSTPVPSWLKLDASGLTLDASAGTKSRSGTVYLEVETEEWVKPLKVSCSVSAKYTAPSLKLSASSATFASDIQHSGGVLLTLRPGNRKDTLETLRVSGLEAPDGFVAEGFDRQTGTFRLRATKTVSSGKKYLQVSFQDTSKTLSLPITVSAQTVKVTLQKSSVTLNAVVGDQAQVALKTTPTDYTLTQQPQLRLVDSKGKDATGALDAEYRNGSLWISTNAATAHNTSYKLFVSVPGSKEASLTIKTMKQTTTKPTMSLKASGSVDLLYPDSEAKITASYKNYNGEAPLTYQYSVISYKGKTMVEDVTNAFQLRQDGKQYYISRKADAQLQTGLTYKLTLTVQLPDGQSCTATASFSVKRTEVKLKLSASSITLNKKVGDAALVKVSCTTKNVTMQNPLIEIRDSSGKNPADGRLSISQADGVVTVTTNDQSEYGKSYRVLIRASEKDPAVTLKVSVRKSSASEVSVKLKLSGSLDMAKQSSAITVKPSYSNYIGGLQVTQKLKIFTTENGKTYNVDVTDQFKIRQLDNGSLTIASDSVDHTRKYRVQLTAEFADGTTCTSALSSISVTAGKVTVKAAPAAVTLYRNDRFSRADFSLSPKSDTYRPVARAEIKNSNLAKLYEVHNYGDGAFAIGFQDALVSSKVKSQKITLNVFLEGNNTAKPNTTITLNVTIR